MIQEASHQINYLRNGLKPYARTRTVAFQKPKRFSFYEISPVTESSTPLLSSSLVASDCKQSQPLLKSAPPSDQSQPHKYSNEKKKDVLSTISAVSRHIIQIALFARLHSSNYQREI